MTEAVRIDGAQSTEAVIDNGTFGTRTIRFETGRLARQAAGARSLLLRVQAARQKREASNVASDQSAWIEHTALGLMGAALGRNAPNPPADAMPTPAAEAEPAPACT